VVASEGAPLPDAAKALSDRRELGRALALSHAQVWKRPGLASGAGPDDRFGLAGTAGQGKPAQALTVTETLRASAPVVVDGGGGALEADFALVQERPASRPARRSSRRAGVLYTRSRYGRFTRWQDHAGAWRYPLARGPSSAALSTTARLLWRELAVAPSAETRGDLGGRKTLRLTLSQAERPFGPRPKEDPEHPERAWRLHRRRAGPFWRAWSSTRRPAFRSAWC